MLTDKGEFMKKVFLVCAGLLMGLIIGCSSESEPEPEPDLNEYIQEAYDAGKRDAIISIMEEACGDDSYYIDSHMVGEIIVNYFGKDDDYAYLVRDDILCHPDIDGHYAYELLSIYVDNSDVEDLHYEDFPESFE